MTPSHSAVVRPTRPGPLVLVAASGLAREVLAVVRAHRTHDVVGFFDDSPDLRGRHVAGVPVLGAIDAVVAHPDVGLLVCAGHGLSRARIVDRLASLGVSPDRYATVIHPRVEVPDGSTVAAGSILLGSVVLTTSVRVGAHVVVMPNVTLTHDDVVEDFATLCAGVSLGGAVHVGRGAYLGMNAAVRERVHVGAGATLGMGAALLGDLPDDETWAGVPARRVVRATPDEITNPTAGVPGAGPSRPAGAGDETLRDRAHWTMRTVGA